MELAERVYVDVGDDGGFVYTRIVGAELRPVPEDELEAMKGQWRFFYSDEAIEQLKVNLYGV